MPANRTTLTRYNLDDVVVAFGATHRPLRRALVRTMAWWPAYRLAQTLVEADERAATVGITAACAHLVTRIAGATEPIGAACIPITGPLICVANHPGLVDAPALVQTIGRDDVRIIAAERPLLRAMPGFAPYLIEVPDAGPGRAHALRAAVRHVRAGGALLTFPAGRIEADPAVLDDAQATLPLWSDMPAILRRAVPNATVVALLVSGVTSARALHHPWVQRVPVRRDREWLAATLQLIIPWFRAPVVRVRVTDVAPLDGVGAAMFQLLYDERRARGLPPPVRSEDLP